jgi:CheY-like chemotaxis protein
MKAVPQGEPTELGGTVKLQSKILWVDDRPDNNIYERMAFEALGITFTLARSTREALECLQQERFSAIISDMERHGMDTEGFTLLDELRHGGDLTPFFIYSAGQKVRLLKTEAKNRGAQGLTIDAQELFEMVTEALGIDFDRELPRRPRKPRRTPKLI